MDQTMTLDAQLTPPVEPAQPKQQSVVLKIASGKEIMEITIDPDQPVVDMTNNAVTWILCSCGEHLISSQRQLEPERTFYHVHCPKCWLAGIVPGDAWRKMLAMLAPQRLVS